MAYSIGDVSRVLGITASALHYYEKEGLIKKPMEDSGWRSYEEEDVYRLISVKKYRAMGVSLREIAQQFSHEGMDAQQIVRRMKEKRDEAGQMARHYAALCEDIDALVAAGENAVCREGIVDIRPAPDMLVLRPGEGGLIPRKKEEQAIARSWLDAQPAVGIGIARDLLKDRAEMVLLMPKSRAKDYDCAADGKLVQEIPGGMALHAVVSSGLERYDTPDDIFRPILQFAREHRFEPRGIMWGKNLFVDCSNGTRRYYYDTYMVFD